MRKRSLLFLAVTLILAMLAGCGSQTQEPKREASAPAAGDMVIVHNVDELISAIAPGARIQLAEGNYYLIHSATYGQRSGNPYVKWEDRWSGYALLIHDVDDLTIVGSGKETTNIISECPEADVLKFEDCTGVVLEDFTAGHAPQSEGCAAGVVSFYRSADVRAHQLGLFGCGAVGISASRTERLTVEQCEIYDCSHSGIDLMDCQNVNVEQTSFHNIGKPDSGFDTGYAAITSSESKDVQLRNCELTENNLMVLLSMYDSKGVVLTGNRIANNSVAQSMFAFTDTGIVIDSSNVFEDNAFSHWYATPWEGGPINYAVDERGNPVFTEDPEPVHTSSDPVEPETVINGDQKTVWVSTVDQLLAAIDSNTEIILTAPMYDLSTAADYGMPGRSEHYTWVEEFDGWELVIVGVENFSILGAEDEMNHTISAVPRYADVITFQGCSNILLRGFTAGHTVEPGYCSGGVLNFEYCSNASVDLCHLYGCGIFGVTAYQCTGLSVTNDCIYECSQGGIMCMETDCLTIGGCTFWDLGGDTFQLSGCTNVTIDGRAVAGTYYGN